MADSPPNGSAVRSVCIERRGGFAGLHPTVEHDYTALTSGQKQALDGLLSAPANAPPAAPSPGADRFSYRVKVQHADGADRLLDVPEDAMPVSLAGLVKPTLP